MVQMSLLGIVLSTLTPRLGKHTLRILKEYRKLLAGSLMTLGNLSVVSLIFGQAVAREALNWRFVTLGLAIFAIGHLVAYVLMKGVGDQ